jgi:hypothetical protein
MLNRKNQLWVGLVAVLLMLTYGCSSSGKKNESTEGEDPISDPNEVILENADRELSEYEKSLISDDTPTAQISSWSLSFKYSDEKTKAFTNTDAEKLVPTQTIYNGAKYTGIRIKDILNFYTITSFHSMNATGEDGKKVTLDLDEMIADDTLIAWANGESPIGGSQPIDLCPSQFPQKYLSGITKIEVLL